MSCRDECVVKLKRPRCKTDGCDRPASICYCAKTVSDYCMEHEEKDDE